MTKIIHTKFSELQFKLLLVSSCYVQFTLLPPKVATHSFPSVSMVIPSGYPSTPLSSRSKAVRLFAEMRMVTMITAIWFHLSQPQMYALESGSSAVEDTG
jgi:hypothetical protein